MAQDQARQPRDGAPLALLLVLGASPFAACNCDDGGVSELYGLLEVEPLLLDLGEVPIGVKRVGAVTARNRGESPLILEVPRIVGDPAFTLEEPLVATALPAAGSVPIRVDGRPTKVGTATATLFLASDDQTIAPIGVVLRIVGVDPPPCDDGNACTRDIFDEASAGCRHAFDDGAPCSPRDRCVIDAVCSQGVCLGSSKVCADSSPCTRDLCRQSDGVCVFFPDPSGCDDHNPCTADACGTSGCVHEPVATGLACDDGNPCSRGDTCVLGECRGAGVGDGAACDDDDSCTIDDLCLGGICAGTSLIERAREGEVVFEYRLVDWDRAFLHRREVSMGEDGTLFALDHLPLFDPEPGLTHVVTTLQQCGTPHYEFSYRPPDTHVLVARVRREMQLTPDNTLRLVVGIRQLPEAGFLPQTTSYLLDPNGTVLESRIQVLGGETGRSLLPDGSSISGVVWPLNENPTPDDSQQNFVIIREDRDGRVLWRHERASSVWSEFLGVAGPRVLFGASIQTDAGYEQRFGALDFNTGDLVWSVTVGVIAKEMALSTALNLGVARIGTVAEETQLLGVEIIEGREVFRYPASEDLRYVPRTDPVIAPDGRILVLMQKSELDELGSSFVALGLEWVELGPDGSPISITPLPFEFPFGFEATRKEDDSYPTVADDGTTYVGYGDQLWAIEPGGRIRWTVTSTLPNGFTGTVPLLRADGVVIVNDGDRRLIGIRTNGGEMTDAGWSSFRHDNRRTNYTP